VCSSDLDAALLTNEPRHHISVQFWDGKSARVSLNVPLSVTPKSRNEMFATFFIAREYLLRAYLVYAVPDPTPTDLYDEKFYMYRLAAYGGGRW
jgi:hypothetical protein